MLLNKISSKVVVGKIIRNIRMVDSSFTNDFQEWLGEALRIAQVSNALELKYTQLKVKNHKALLPCGIESIQVVVYDNVRLREGSAMTVPGHNPPPTGTLINAGVYSYNIQQTIANNEQDRISGTDIIPLPNNYSTTDYYIVQMDYIQTSFCDGCIELHYKAFPLDDEGYPTIPNNENYIQALYWWLMSCIVQAGYKLNENIAKEFTYNYCLNMFEVYARRGMNEMKFWNIDTAEKVKQSTVRLVLPYSMYEDFGINYEQIQQNGYL